MSPSFCVLLLLAAAAAVNAADSKVTPSPMFVDWLSQQSSTKVRSAGYEEVETESVCLQETKLRNCRCLNTIGAPAALKCNREYSESTLSCCNSHGPSSFMTEKPLMSVCNWVEDFFEKEVEYDGTATKKIGVFTVTCEMREDSEKCGSPLCEGMNVIASGDILRYPSVAFLGSSEPDDLPRTKDCTPEGGLLPEPLGARSGVASRVAAKVQYSRHDEEAPEATFWVGSGDIYSGTFRVTSRYHATKYKVGQFQMAYPTENKTLMEHPTLPEKAYVAKANQINMEFLKTDAY